MKLNHIATLLLLVPIFSYFLILLIPRNPYLDSITSGLMIMSLAATIGSVVLGIIFVIRKYRKPTRNLPVAFILLGLAYLIGILNSFSLSTPFFIFWISVLFLFLSLFFWILAIRKKENKYLLVLYIVPFLLLFILLFTVLSTLFYSSCCGPPPNLESI